MTPLERILAGLAWESLFSELGLPPPRKLMQSPFREDRSPSFAVGETQCIDFATGERFGKIDLAAKALNTDLSGASRWLLERFAGGPKTSFVPTAKHATTPKRESEKPRPTLPTIDRGSYGDVMDLATVRKLKMTAGILGLVERGTVGFCTYQNFRCWIVLDASGRVAQVRRLDGLPFGTAKAKTLQGSEAAWPVGITDAVNRPCIVFCEGGPDMLAAALVAWVEGSLNHCAVVGILGASQKIHPEALPLFQGKRVRIFQHHDTAGRDAALRWGWQLKPIAAEIDVWTSDREGEDLNDFVSRTWGLVDDPENPMPERITPTVNDEPRREAGAA